MSEARTTRLMTEAEAAKYLKVSRQFLRKSRCDGNRTGHAKAPAWVQPSGARLVKYDIQDLDAWIAEHRCTPSAGKEG